MFHHLKLRFVPLCFLIIALVGSVTLLPIPVARAINTPWLSTQGRFIKDPSGNTVILRGVSLVDVSVANSRTRNAVTQTNMATDNANGWYARVVRFPVYPNAIDGQPGWIANPDAYYNNHLNPAIQNCVARQIYCIIDWHYIADYNNSTIDTSTRNFWTYIAPKYANTPNVIFELYNEPINPDNWSTWKTWAQPWVNIIRAAAPNNLILIGGPRWSQNVAEAATNPFTGSNLAYVAHIYPQHGGQSVWDSWFGNSSATVPYFITEWGWQNGGGVPTSGTTSGFGSPFSAYLDSKGVSWTAWVHDVSWQPVMFDANWNLLGGENFMGQFTKDFLFNRRNDNLPGGATATPTRTNTPVGPTNTPTRTNTPTPGGTIRVESGGTANFTDTSGNVWAADNSFSGGSTADRGAIAIANTTNDRIYQTERYGNPFSYAFNVANGTYTVNLHFAETFFTSSGQRVFSVTAEGTTIVSNLDIFAAAGGANTALIRTANVTVNDGQLNLNFTASVNNALVNGIEIIPGSGPTATPTRTNTPIGPTNTPTRTNTPVSSNLLTNGGIESGTTGWTCNNCTGTSDTTQFHSGTHSLSITGRAAAWAGPEQNVTSQMTNGRNYPTEVWVKLASGTASARIKIKLVASTTTYITMTPDIAVNATGWTRVSGTGTVSWSGTLTQAVWYVETATGTTSFYMDDAVLN